MPRKKTDAAMANILAGQEASEPDEQPAITPESPDAGSMAGQHDGAPESQEASEPAQSTKTKETYRIATDLAEALNRAWLQRKMVDRTATKSALVEDALRAYLGLG